MLAHVAVAEMEALGATALAPIVGQHLLDREASLLAEEQLSERP